MLVSIQTRTRTRQRIHTGKTRYNGGDPYYNVSRQTLYEVMDDVIGNRNHDNALVHSRTEIEGSILNGVSGGAVNASYIDCPSRFTRTFPATAHLTVGSLGESLDSMWSRFLANTNPSRPEFALPTFIAEMKDLPGMLHQTGKFAKRLAKSGALRLDKKSMISHLLDTVEPTPYGALSAAKRAGAANLAVQFGWAPLLSDIIKATQFMESLDRRSQELERLYSGRGLKRRMVLASGNSTHTATEYVCNKPVMSASFTHMREIQVWAVCRWRLTARSPPIPRGDDLRRRLLGIDSGAIAETLWELLPWSWLADYFSNVGDLVKLTNNHLAAIASGTIMTKRSTISSHPGGGGGYVKVSGGIRTSIDQQRLLKNGLVKPQFGIPILGAKQSSILGSIAVLRIR